MKYDLKKKKKRIVQKVLFDDLNEKCPETEVGCEKESVQS